MKRLPAALILPFILAGCTMPTTPAGRFYGTAKPTTPGPLCPPSKAVAQIRDDVLILSPDEGTWLLEGIAAPDGTLTADRTRAAARGQTWETTFTGRWTLQTVTGTYRTPRCTYQIDLSKP